LPEMSSRRRYLVLAICCMSLFIVGAAGAHLRDHRGALARLVLGLDPRLPRGRRGGARGAARLGAQAGRAADRPAVLPIPAVLRRRADGHHRHGRVLRAPLPGHALPPGGAGLPASPTARWPVCRAPGPAPRRGSPRPAGRSAPRSASPSSAPFSPQGCTARSPAGSRRPPGPPGGWWPPWASSWSPSRSSPRAGRAMPAPPAPPS
jgi:hypothetical protein